MNNEQLIKNFTKVGTAVLIALAFLIGSSYGESQGRNDALKSLAPAGVNVTNDQLAPFWKVWATLNDKFVEATTTQADTEKRIWGAISGLASSQGDPYTVFFPPVENKMFQSDIRGNFDGVGMEIAIKDKVLTVVAPVKNSPAERAGVRAGDKIIKIEDKVTADLPVDEAVKLIRGKRGTPVIITFFREGVSEPLVKTLIRDVIEIPTLDTSTKGDIYVIKLFSFTSESPQLFRAAMRDFLQSGKNKLILDLRGNPGGYLDAAWDIGSWFLPAGKIIVTEDFGAKSSTENVVLRSKGYDVMAKYFGQNYKMVVLVDGGSASASEILAGALNEQGVAKLVGTKTFGKGSVQELVEITPETSLKVTIARWLTPSGHNLSHDGLEPDYKVEMTQKDIDNKKDPQMDKAVEILSK
jgi:carboxyl-terminal processing protease